jgi:hypothetical protein
MMPVSSRLKARLPLANFTAFSLVKTQATATATSIVIASNMRLWRQDTHHNETHLNEIQHKGPILTPAFQNSENMAVIAGLMIQRSAE